MFDSCLFNTNQNQLPTRSHWIQKLHHHDIVCSSSTPASSATPVLKHIQRCFLSSRWCGFQDFPQDFWATILGSGEIEIPGATEESGGRISAGGSTRSGPATKYGHRQDYQIRHEHILGRCPRRFRTESGGKTLQGYPYDFTLSSIVEFPLIFLLPHPWKFFLSWVADWLVDSFVSLQLQFWLIDWLIDWVFQCVFYCLFTRLGSETH